MSNYSVPLLIRRRWQARPVWTSPVAIALGLHVLLLAVPDSVDLRRSNLSEFLELISCGLFMIIHDFLESFSTIFSVVLLFNSRWGEVR